MSMGSRAATAPRSVRQAGGRHTTHRATLRARAGGIQRNAKDDRASRRGHAWRRIEAPARCSPARRRATCHVAYNVPCGVPRFVQHGVPRVKQRGVQRATWRAMCNAPLGVHRGVPRATWRAMRHVACTVACTVACHRATQSVAMCRFTVRGGRAVLHGGAAAGGRERRAGAEVQEARNGPASVRPREYCSAAGLNGLTPMPHSAPGLGSPPCHICPGTGLAPMPHSAPGLGSPPCHISAQPHPNANRIGAAWHAACVPARHAMCPYPRRNRFSRCMPDATCDCCSGAPVCAQPADHVLPRVGPARARRPDARGSPTCARSHSRPFPLRRHALPRVRSGPSAHGGPRWRPQPPGSALARFLPTVLAVRSPRHWPVPSHGTGPFDPRHWPVASHGTGPLPPPRHWPRRGVGAGTARRVRGNGRKWECLGARVGTPWRLKQYPVWQVSRQRLTARIMKMMNSTRLRSCFRCAKANAACARARAASLLRVRKERGTPRGNATRSTTRGPAAMPRGDATRPQLVDAQLRAAQGAHHPAAQVHRSVVRPACP